ncbi:hypothetical protein [Stieleria varia]|uniref:Uncharacterized protein n=2 Tax=Stieleria varia TaxID=2528005 RepID=A0A5C6AXP3_9BACT|nr:hypothetical protein [Stieleria varia]TWU02904.1 hypothetical protein Pla52n_39920 [Stieleria varia]
MDDVGDVEEMEDPNIIAKRIERVAMLVQEKMSGNLIGDSQRSSTDSDDEALSELSLEEEVNWMDAQRLPVIARITAFAIASNLACRPHIVSRFQDGVTDDAANVWCQIRIRRFEKHLELAQLTEQFWISPQYPASLEHGEFEEGDDALIEKLDDILDSPPRDRLAFEGFRQLFPRRSTSAESVFALAFRIPLENSPVFF